VQAHNYHDATGFFRQNWPTIELMARESLARRRYAVEVPNAVVFRARAGEPRLK
jgi:hypothetical protein